MSQPSQEYNPLFGDAEFLAVVDNFKAAQARLGEEPLSAGTESAEWEAEYQRIVTELDNTQPPLAGLFDYPSEPYEDALPDVHASYSYPEPKWGIRLPDSQRETRPTTDELGRPYLVRDVAGYGRYMWESTFAPFDAPKIDGRKVLATAAAATVLLTGIMTDQKPDSDGEQDLDHRPTPTGLLVRYTDEKAVVTLPSIEGQDKQQSIADAASASQIAPEDQAVHGKDYLLPATASPEQIQSAVIAFMAPDGSSEQIAEETTPALATDISAEVEPEFNPLPKSPEQMTDSEYIDWLVSNVHPSAEKYEWLEIDTSREDVFKDELSGERIQPKAFVGHWTAGTYKNGVDQFVSAIKNREGNCCSVMYFMDKDAKIYRFTDSWEKTAHAAGANTFTQGVEIEADDLRGYTPEQMLAFVNLAYRFLKANDLPISRETFLGHAEVDAEHGNHQKIDMPSELVDKLLPKLLELDQELQAQAPTEDVSPETSPSAEEAYKNAMAALLTEIASHEGGWDSVNTGTAGDTKLGGDKYQQLFDGRMLSQLTLQEILDMQAQDKLFAVGRYQFIPATLASAVKATGIDTSRPFDAATQNELAVDYLILGGKREGLRDYLTGKSDDINAAINDAAREWASLPSTDGTGFYDGDSAGNNAAGGVQRVEHMKKLLNDIRAAYLAKQQPTPAPPVPEPRQPEQRKVVVLGDSLTVGMQEYGGLETKDENHDLNVIAVSAKGGRSLEAGPTTGLQALDSLMPQVQQSDIVVLGYGTNAHGSEAEYEQALRHAVEQIGPEKTVAIPRITAETKSRDERNAIIERVAKETGAHVIDYGDVIKLGGDRIHASNYEDVADDLLGDIAELPSHEQEVIENRPPMATTTTVPSVGPVAQEEVTRQEYLSGGLFVDEARAKHIYEPYFRGDERRVDLEALAEWVESLPQISDGEGNIRYEIRIDNVPEMARGDK